MTKILQISMLSITLLFFSNCESNQDPNYQWLLAVLQPVAPVTPGQTPQPAATVPVTVNVGDVQGNPAFVFNTTQTVPVTIIVRDPTAPVAGSLVQIRYANVNGDQLIFQAVTSASGNVTGSFTINRAEPKVMLTVTVSGQTYNFQIDLTNVTQISRFLVVGAQITPIIISDRDQDGVADSQDAYPDDPLRASLIRIPAESYYTIAYEDLYPKKGDADFNDFVVQVYNEQDLNAKGEIVRIRGHYTHVAKGAGYNHTLNLNFPGLRGSSYSLKRYGFTGALENELPGTIPDSGIVELLPSSNTTIAASNSQPNTVLKTGKSAEIEITLNTPKTTAGFSPAPYDLFLHVITTNRDIHFLGNLFKPDGTDQYLDSDGFPWAIQIPGNWKWPYEQKDIRNAYEFFDDWYISKGMEKKDWYNFPNQSLVFPN